jgi:hypothetical protein
VFLLDRCRPVRCITMTTSTKLTPLGSTALSDRHTSRHFLRTKRIRCLQKNCATILNHSVVVKQNKTGRRRPTKKKKKLKTRRHFILLRFEVIGFKNLEYIASLLCWMYETLDIELIPKIETFRVIPWLVSIKLASRILMQ